MNTNFMEVLPLSALFIIIVTVIYFALFLGFKLGSGARKDEDTSSVPPIGAVVASMLGLLAFILALTFNSSANRYEARKLLLLEETNTIGTVYLRSDFLTPTDRDETKRLLREYVDVRVQILSKPEKAKEVIAHSEKIQKQLWKIAVSYPKENISPTISARYSDALNKLLDIHTKRIVYGLQYKIHPTIWYSLFGVAILSMGALGFQFGISGGRRYQISLLLALCFSTILLLILDLDRPGQGSIRVSQEPLEMLRAAIKN